MSTTDAIYRIYDDARVWLNVAEGRDIEKGEKIPEGEFIAQLEAEGYEHEEATLILDNFDDDGVLDRSGAGVVPTVFNITVDAEEVAV
jgi:hypothetical protein